MIIITTINTFLKRGIPLCTTYVGLNYDILMTLTNIVLHRQPDTKRTEQLQMNYSVRNKSCPTGIGEKESYVKILP